MNRKMLAVWVAATISLGLLAGCNSGAKAELTGPNGKTYSGTEHQVTQKVGADYGAGLKAMAEQRGR